MKLNLLLGGPNALSGYANVDPFAVPGDGKVHGTLTDLSPHCEEAQAAELVANEVLDFIPPSLLDATLAHWASRLRHGGTLSLTGLDLAEVCRRVANRTLSADDANRLLYGGQDEPWRCRKSSVPLTLLCDKLRSLGLTITRKGYHECHYAVTAARP